MKDFTIECPNCKVKIKIDDVLSGKVFSDFKTLIDSEIKKIRESELAHYESELKRKYEDKITQIQLEFAKKEHENSIRLKQRENMHKLEIEQIRREYELKISTQMSSLQQTIELLQKQLEESKREIDEKRKELEIARKLEVELRKRATELEEKEKNLELEIQRRLSLERNAMAENIRKTIDTEYLLKLQEKELTINSMQKKIEELNMKLQLGSQQTKGEAQEIVLEDLLTQSFPFDSIEPVPKGIRGADIIQVVRNRYGLVCGKILWESKRTSAWNNEWIPKLKEDQREIGAELAVIVSRTLPKEINFIGLLNGVWVCDFDRCIGLAMALREILIQVQSIRNTFEGRDTKMEQIFNYICSEQFTQKVKAIVEAFVNMKSDLEKEKISMEKHWKKREEELNRVIKNTARIYGELEAIVGRQLPEIPVFQLPGLEKDYS
ncbi:MAG: DUF2130 domain-containing protein [Ignavibacteria bacterium]|nr:DUF2130 domain-containing protein [Ignavibacteria bacterium]